MALIDGGRRSADIVADERTVCYGFSVEQLREVGREYPNLLVTIMGSDTAVTGSLVTLTYE